MINTNDIYHVTNYVFGLNVSDLVPLVPFTPYFTL